MEHATSADGTRIAFDRLGSGPPVILVCGGSVDRMSHAGLAALLAEELTVLNYDRRGRGDSGDTPPYEEDREIEDIDAVAHAAGGSAFLYGSSSGAALAMDAAARLDSITKVALWEPPFLPEGAPRPPSDTERTFHDLVAAGRRDEAVEFFMRDVVRLPPEFVEGAKQAPFWGATVALAHTLEYDARIMGDYSIPTDRAAAVKVPALVAAGGSDFPWMPETAQTIAGAMADGRMERLEGQGHNVDPSVLAPVLIGFFRD
jgi:alpha-beta hydrolase superfamily lysophospholipase